MRKMTKMPKCEICKENEAEWAMQYIASDTPTFSFLGWHYRGFQVTKVCDSCREKLERRIAETMLDEDGTR